MQRTVVASICHLPECLLLHVCSGQVVSTISRGRLVWHNGKLNITRGTGRFIPTPTFGPLFEGLDKRPEHLVDVARYGGVPVQRGSIEGKVDARDEL